VDLKTAELCGHRYRRTHSDLLKDGYSKSLLDELQDNDNVWLATEPELVERHQQTDDVMTERLMDSGETSDKTVMVYECYAELDVDGNGTTRSRLQSPAGLGFPTQVV
jgi:hypothetical protein